MMGCGWWGQSLWCTSQVVSWYCFQRRALVSWMMDPFGGATVCVTAKFFRKTKLRHYKGQFEKCYTRVELPAFISYILDYLKKCLIASNYVESMVDKFSIRFVQPRESRLIFPSLAGPGHSSQLISDSTIMPYLKKTFPLLLTSL